ncbi:MAG: hypothetical protein JJ895_02645 [Balneolaceae bacterium]|nr:hypothetical protein [Balneolaceae bacterium]
MRTTIDLPDDLMKSAKIRAVEEGISLKQLFIRALKNELNPSIKIVEEEPVKQVDTSFRKGLSKGTAQLKSGKSGFSTFKLNKS